MIDATDYELAAHVKFDVNENIHDAVVVLDKERYLFDFTIGGIYNGGEYFVVDYILFYGIESLMSGNCEVGIETNVRIEKVINEFGEYLSKQNDRIIFCDGKDTSIKIKSFAFTGSIYDQ